MDTLTKIERSRIMGLVRSKDTRPELIVRRLLHSLGYRYRLHVRTLPGCPDLVFSSRHKVVFVHGCFWHRHACAMGRRIPKSRVRFWTEKLEGNKRRDSKSLYSLRRQGWKTLTVWECQLEDVEALGHCLKRFLGKLTK